MRAFNILFCLSLGLSLLFSSCKDDDDDDNPFNLSVNITSQSCNLMVNTPTCPDGNLFVVNIAGNVSGPVGTLAAVFYGSETPITSSFDCGSWTAGTIINGLVRTCTREAGQPETTNFTFTGNLRCIPENSFFGAQTLAVELFEPEAQFVLGGFGEVDAPVTVNCVL